MLLCELIRAIFIYILSCKLIGHLFFSSPVESLCQTPGIPHCPSCVFCCRVQLGSCKKTLTSSASFHQVFQPFFPETLSRRRIHSVDHSLCVGGWLPAFFLYLYPQPARRTFCCDTELSNSFLSLSSCDAHGTRHFPQGLCWEASSSYLNREKPCSSSSLTASSYCSSEYMVLFRS